MKAEDSIQSQLSRRITRRQLVKAGGIAAIGLVFSKPIIDTIRPIPAFASGYGPVDGGHTDNCCPNGLAIQDTTLLHKTHRIPYVGEAFLEVTGPAEGSSCCNTAIGLALGINSMHSQYVCDKLEHLAQNDKIKIETDGIPMSTSFNRVSLDECSLRSHTFFDVTCDDTTGCQCSYRARHTTTVVIPFWRGYAIKMELVWGAYIEPDADTPCEVGTSGARIISTSSYYVTTS